MKKANQTPGTATYTERDLKELLSYLDTGARKRSNFEANIKREADKARNLEKQITIAGADLEATKLNLTKLETEFAALPEDGMGIEEGKALMDKIAGLPWVERVELNTNILHIFTRQGVLKTDFYNRMVIGNGNRTNELLMEVATLPLPQYEITLDLRNMGSSWAVNPALSIRLSNPQDYNSFQAMEGGWEVHEPRPHWACNNNPGDWGTLCLGDYDKNLFEGAKRGLLGLLEELAIFLQRSGWSSAYVNKVAWSTLMGNPVYNQYLLRAFRPGEDVDSIVADNRKRMADFLKANNLTSNMYQYGSHGSDDDDDRCYDCDCESEPDEDCECDCHADSW